MCYLFRRAAASQPPTTAATAGPASASRLCDTPGIASTAACGTRARNRASRSSRNLLHLGRLARGDDEHGEVARDLAERERRRLREARVDDRRPHLRGRVVEPRRLASAPDELDELPVARRRARPREVGEIEVAAVEEDERGQACGVARGDVAADGRAQEWPRKIARSLPSASRSAAACAAEASDVYPAGVATGGEEPNPGVSGASTRSPYSASNGPGRVEIGAGHAESVPEEQGRRGFVAPTTR